MDVYGIEFLLQSIMKKGALYQYMQGLFPLSNDRRPFVYGR